MATLVSPTTTPVRQGARLWRFRVPAAIVTLVMVLTGGHNLVVGWNDPLDGGIHRVQDLHWGVAEGLLLGVAMGLQLRRPAGHPAAMRVVLLAAVSQLVVALATADPDPFGIVLFVLVVLAAAAHPARDQVLHPDRVLEPRRLVVALPAAGALAVFAAVQVAHHGHAAPHDLLVAKTGYIGAAISCLALALLCLSSALTRSRTTTVFAALGLGVLGAASLVHPHLASSWGTVGGLLAIAAALALAIPVQTSRRAF